MAKKKAAKKPAVTPAERSTFQAVAAALGAYAASEGKGPADVVTFDDIYHAAQFGGAAPDAK